MAYSKATSKVISFKQEDGTSLYMWVAYSHYSDGTNPSMSPIEKREGTDTTYSRYMGIAYNKEYISPGRLVKEDYQWVSITGATGTDGYSVSLSPSFTGIPVDGNGSVLDLSKAYTQVNVMQGKTHLAKFEVNVTEAVHATYEYNESNKTIYVTGIVSDTARIDMEVLIDGNIIAKLSYHLAKVYGTNSLGIPTTVNLDVDQMYFISYERQKGETYMTPISYFDYEAYDTSVKIADRKIGSNLTGYSEEFVFPRNNEDTIEVNLGISYVSIDKVYIGTDSVSRIPRSKFQIVSPSKIIIYNVNTFITSGTEYYVVVEGIHYVYTS